MRSATAECNKEDWRSVWIRWVEAKRDSTRIGSLCHPGRETADLVQDQTRSCTQPIGLWTWWKPLMHPLPACMATSLSLTPLAMIIASAAWLHWLHRFCLHENYSATASIMLQSVYIIPWKHCLGGSLLWENQLKMYSRFTTYTRTKRRVSKMSPFF